MSLRRRDLFWQESEKGGGPGDGDTIVYAANVTRPGLVQKNLIWRSGLAQDIAFLSWTDNDRELLAGNPLLSPDGTYIIWPSVERDETTGQKQVPGIAGIYRGTNDTDWEVVTDPNGNRVLASKNGLGNSESSIFTFMPEARVNLYVCTDGENGYDYLTVSQDGTVLYNGKNQSQQGATSFQYTKLTIEPGTEVTLTYQKDLSNSMYSDRAYAYIGGVEGIGGTITLDSTTWEVSGTLASGQTVYKSAIKGQASTTASAYIRIQPTETGSLTLMCRSNGEEGYDYLKVYELDSTTSVLKSFRSETSATDYTAVEFNIPDTESHFIYVEYVKDSFGDAGEDAAFVYIGTSGRYDMSSTVEATVTVTSYCRSFEKYKLDTGTRTAYTYSYSSTIPSDLLKTEYGVPQFLVPKTFDSDTVTFNEGHMSSSDYKYIPVYASARLSNTGLELTTGSIYTSESVMSQTQLFYGAVKYSDNGDLFCTIPLSGSYNSYVSASEYFQSASICVYLSRRVNDTDYGSERILDLLPVDSGSTSTVVVDAAFNRTGKITYVVGNQLTESTVVTFSSHLYRSTDKAVSFEHLDWAPGDSSEHITAVCTNFSGKVVYVLTGTVSYDAWVSASVYRSEDYGRTFNRQNKFECKGPSYVTGSAGKYDRLKAAVHALDPRYRMQIACSGKGDRLAVWLVSGSDWQSYKNQGLIFRSDDSGLTWAGPVETDKSILHSQPRILTMNRN